MASKRARWRDIDRPDGRKFIKLEPVFVTEEDRENERVAAEAFMPVKGYAGYVATKNELDDIDFFFTNDKGDPVAFGEVKRRNNKLSKYRDTAIIYAKIKKLQRLATKDRPAYLLVYWDDQIGYLDISELKESDCKFGMMTRRDCGKTERDYMIYIPNHLFTICKFLPLSTP